MLPIPVVSVCLTIMSLRRLVVDLKCLLEIIRWFFVCLERGRLEESGMGEESEND